MTEYFTKGDDGEYKKVDEELLSPSAVNGIVERRLEKQKTNQFGDYDELKEKAEKFDSTTQDFETKLKTAGDEKSALEKQLADAQLETVKVKAVHEFKLTDELSEFLNGTDEKTIRSQAEKLSKGVAGGSVVIKKNEKPEDKKATDSKKVAQDIFGKKSDD